MKRLLREPLVHFLLLGAAIFAAYSLISKGGYDAGKIVVTRGQLEAMQEGYVRTWQRPPTREEMEGLVRDRVREEVYYREALVLGLDKDDVVIRRRLRQKMEFVSHDVAASVEPSDPELEAYLRANASAFAVDNRYSFRQVYLNPRRHGENPARDANDLLAVLKRAGDRADFASLGDPLMIGHAFSDVSAGEVGSLFGEKFAARLGTLATGEWQGPVESGYGLHLVYIVARMESGPPPLASVRKAVLREWTGARQREAESKFYQALLRKYSVTIETPAAVPVTSESVAAR
jgi:hypothetical protein